MSKFSEMPLIKPLLHNLKEAGFKNPTPIQSLAIPLLLEGSDLFGIAQTGTGKTAAFALPLIQHLIGKPAPATPCEPRGLILVPTRELASQVSADIQILGKGLGLKSEAIFGGVDQFEQVGVLKTGIDIVVATPGRLLDLLEQKLVRLQRVEILVLDEADRMLDMGFIDDLKAIMAYLPAKRQSMLFSATMPQEIITLGEGLLRSPKKVEAAPESTVASKIQQKVILCKKEDKFQLLKKILKEEETNLVIVFTKTKETADRVREYLKGFRIAAAVFHGDKEQKEREVALDNFKNGYMKILIATDIAARGIDISGVGHVINFDLPLAPESYVHRIGRTARAGNEGVAISFCDESEKGLLEKIQTLIKKVLPAEKFKGSSEAKKVTTAPKVKAPTPGKSQDKTAYLDHSKRQRVVPEGAPKPKPHPGFKGKKKKR